MATGTAFRDFWRTQKTRESLLTLLSTEDLSAMRLTCHAFATPAAPYLFCEIQITFRSSTFARHSSIAALQRIGQHVKTFHFRMPHTEDTLLAPLIDPFTGEEIPFIYEPYTRMVKDSTARLSIPSYGSWEMTDLLVKQYPPLFHAAANAPMFIKVLGVLPQLEHLQVSCPGQDSQQRYRRSIVDYALISLRLAVERNNLIHLKTLSLLDVHPAAALYLNPQNGFGALPSAMRKWKRIRRLRIRMDHIPINPAASDHYIHLHTYLSIFQQSLRHLFFEWTRSAGPCPVVLHSEPAISCPSPMQACPSTSTSTRQALHFPRLRTMDVTNVAMDADQIADFLSRHHRTVKHTRRLKLGFHGTILRNGTWTEALEPLTRISGNEDWKSSSSESEAFTSLDERNKAESMDVPIMFNASEFQEDELHRVWDEHARTDKPQVLSYVSHLHKASARTRRLLFGTEEHMKRLFSSTVFGWR